MTATCAIGDQREPMPARPTGRDSRACNRSAATISRIAGEAQRIHRCRTACRALTSLQHVIAAQQQQDRAPSLPARRSIRHLTVATAAGRATPPRLRTCLAGRRHLCASARRARDAASQAPALRPARHWRRSPTSGRTRWRPRPNRPAPGIRARRSPPMAPVSACDRAKRQPQAREDARVGVVHRPVGCAQRLADRRRTSRRPSSGIRARASRRSAGGSRRGTWSGSGRSSAAAGDSCGCSLRAMSVIDFFVRRAASRNRGSWRSLIAAAAGRTCPSGRSPATARPADTAASAFERAGAVHFLAHDRLDLAHHAQAQRHPGVDAGRRACLIMPARSISWWLATSASAGASFCVVNRKRDTRMPLFLILVVQDVDFSAKALRGAPDGERGHRACENPSMLLDLPDPRVPSAVPSAAALPALAAAGLGLEAGSSSASDAADVAVDAALLGALAERSGAMLSALFAAAPSVAVYRQLWRRLAAVTARPRP